MDTKRHAPAAERNREPILAVLRRVLPASGTVLEIASGTGQHVAHFAAALPELVWQPSEFDAQALASIAAWTDQLANVRPAIALDVTRDDWQLAVYAAIFNANMIHIAPWATCLGLMHGAERHLAPRGRLILYGPFRIQGEHTAPSNEAFDARLREQDSRWGVRDLEAVSEVAQQHGLVLIERIQMPANNQTLIFERAR